jgi:hypothetical protein
MNSYELSRNFCEWAFNNPEKIKPIHYAIYYFSIEHCNRLGWKDKFGLPSQMVMEAIGVKNWKTYSNGLNELIEFGFIEMIEISKNQYSSNIIAIVKNTKAHTKALDKALLKHSTKHCSITYQSTVSIDKQVTIKQGTIEERKQEFALSLQPYVEKYGREFIKDFYYYWTEETQDKKKLNFELKRTFNIERRLGTWKKNSTKFGNDYTIDNKPKFSPYG